MNMIHSSFVPKNNSRAMPLFSKHINGYLSTVTLFVYTTNIHKGRMNIYRLLCSKTLKPDNPVSVPFSQIKIVSVNYNCKDLIGNPLCKVTVPAHIADSLL